MSQENVEAVRQGLELWEQRGYNPDVFSTPAFHPELEWDISAYPLPDWPNTGRGRENFGRHMGDYVSGWKDYRSDVRELIDARDDVVVILHERVAMPDSDVVLDRDLHGVWTFQDMVVVRVRIFKTRQQALEAAGLSE